MLLMGVGFVGGLGVTASFTVAVTVVASITLLPALLGFAGDQIERTKWRGLVAAGFVAVGARGVGLEIAALAGSGFACAVLTIVRGFVVGPLQTRGPHRPPRPRRETIAYRWSRVIQHRPWPCAIAAAAVLLVLAVPVLGSAARVLRREQLRRTAPHQAGLRPAGRGLRQGLDRPVSSSRRVDGADRSAALDAVTDAVAADPDVASVSGPQPNDAADPDRRALARDPGRRTAGRGDDRARQPPALATSSPRSRQPWAPTCSSPARVAGNVDLSAYLAERLPIFFGAVLALSFLLLMVVFRSLLVPLKAVIMNLLSIGAAYGVIVALFQWGWLGDITGIQPGPIETWVPMMLFAVVFGLSMDYEVFLLSRVREEWLRTGDSRTSVADGLAATAKVITAAAAIMVVVFGSFMLENDRMMKMMGIGLATAILLDATIVRMVLVPAHHGAARRQELVAAPLARPDPAQPRRRGPRSAAARRRCRPRVEP